MIKGYAIGVCRKGLDSLEESAALSPETLHELRVATKRLRGLWKFAEPEIGRKRSRAARKRLRDSARLLSEERDYYVMGKTLARLNRDSLPEKERQTIRKVETFITQKHPREIIEKSTKRELLARALSEELETWECSRSRSKSNGSSIDRRLKKTYARAFDLAKESWRTGKLKSFHKWRRWSKYLLYQLEPLNSKHSAWMDVYIAELKTLGKWLGRRQDLSVLKRFLKTCERLPTNERQILLDLIERADSRALKKCRKLSGRLLTDKPEVFRRRIKKEIVCLPVDFCRR